MKIRRARPKPERCPNCFDETSESSLPLHRLYINKDRRWIGVGWICLRCLFIEIQLPPDLDTDVITDSHHRPIKNLEEYL